MKQDIIIIGAGASGLMAAISAARRGSKVLVIEQKDKAGKKILATGNGKCNYTNLYQAPECYRSEDSTFAMKVLSAFPVKQTLGFFEELGIYPKEREGYLYPNSEQAASVVQVLMMECERLGVSFVYEEKVKEILPEQKKGNSGDTAYRVLTEKLLPSPEKLKQGVKSKQGEKSKQGDQLQRGENQGNKQNSYIASGLILATGGCASPKLGSDGSGYTLAKSLGHTLIKPLPALVQLKSPEKYCKTVSGVRTTGKVIACTEKGKLNEEEGEIIFTDYGISGIPILQISRFVAKALERKEKVELKLDFMPGLEKNTVKKLLTERIERSSNKNLEEMMVGLLNHKLSYIMIKEAGLDPCQSMNSIKTKDIDQLTAQLKEFRMRIADTNSFENAQVCAGGIPTSEIDPATMESKKIKNLYLCGELVDVDGTCGGYNLQWAWSSGHLAGVSAAGAVLNK